MRRRTYTVDAASSRWSDEPDVKCCQQLQKNESHEAKKGVNAIKMALSKRPKKICILVGLRKTKQKEEVRRKTVALVTKMYYVIVSTIGGRVTNDYDIDILN